ncbi:hypothetical protein V6Z11_A05G012900 [Gossypium hirsutum]
MATKTASSPSSKSQARTCLCSPTTHPGSFRCSLHRNFNKPPTGRSRAALLLQIIKPSSHDLQRRRNFQPKPSRFCMLNGNRNGFGVAVS